MPTDRLTAPKIRHSGVRAADLTRVARKFVYTAHDWDAEAYRVYGEGRNPSPCPVCRRTGFYGPRIAGEDRHYRQCRFCGFTQFADEPPVDCRPLGHDCEPWPEVARAPYIWWAPVAEEEFVCAFCGDVLPAVSLVVEAPVSDAAHPWWKVPQHRTRFYYDRFWNNWEFSSGRAFL
jgi:hypothetical protein